jgi:hypothetical protein
MPPPMVRISRSSSVEPTRPSPENRELFRIPRVQRMSGKRQAARHRANGCFRHQCWWPYHKSLSYNMLQPNSALSIPVQVQIGREMLLPEQVKDHSQQWVAEAPISDLTKIQATQELNGIFSLGQLSRESGFPCRHLAAQEDQLCCGAHALNAQRLRHQPG